MVRRFRGESPPLRVAARWCGLAAGAAAAGCLAGCANPGGNIALGVVAGTAVGAYSPAQEIEQVYYLGVFDPHEQVQPQQVYRVTVRGQASALSRMRFGSGWVHASLIDSLNTRVSLADSDRPTLETGDGKEPATDRFKPGRRMVMFGPEGFREAPKDHRLVIVMGASPEAFFQAIDESLGTIAQVRREQADPGIAKQLADELGRLQAEQRHLNDLQADAAATLPPAAAAAAGSADTSAKGN